MDLFNLYARIVLDDDYSDGVKKASSAFGKLKTGIGNIIGTAAKISTVVGTVTAGIAAIGVDAAAEVRAEASAFEQTFGDIQAAASDAIGRVANDAGILETRLNTMGTRIYAFAKASGADSAESLNLMERALRVAADSAAYYDTSVEQATETLQSFLKGNYENDAALGLSATETTRNAAAMELFGQKFNDLTEVQKQQTLLQMVEDSQRLSGAMGQASREADGYANVIGNLKESWRQLKAAFGEPFLDSITPIIQNATAAMQNFTAKVDWEKVANTVTTAFSSGAEAATKLVKIIEQIIPIATFATGVFISMKAGMALQSVVTGFGNAQVALSLLSMQIGSANLAQAALNGTLKASEVLVALLTGKITLAQLATAAMTKAQTALNLVMSANPIAIVVTVIGALVAALVVLYNTNETVRNVIDSAWSKIKDVISAAVNSISTFFTETIPSAVAKALNWFNQIPTRMRSIGKDLITGLWNGISDKIGWLKDKVTGVVDRIKSWFTGPDGFDEHSPSKWSKQVFRYVIDGGIQGLDEGTPALLRDVRSVTDKVKAGMDFGTATVDYQSSGIGNMARSMGNAVANAGATSLDGVTIVVQSVLDGRVIGESAYRYGKQKEMAFGV